MSYATVINWLDDVEKQDHVVYDTPEAVLALLAEIRTDVVGIVSTAETYDVLAAFEAKRSMLSSGEVVLLDLAWGIWRGVGGAPLASLGTLDLDRRKRALAIIVGYYVGACS